ncbi:unnamed protein product [Linum trigynum]|uniref:Uncharacterized protein n=1 Tax=Linum trigynum TaxID=586398 RepID=A0AAV2FD46_9ROSI
MFKSSRRLQKPIKEVPMKCVKVLKRTTCKKGLQSMKISWTMENMKIIPMPTHMMRKKMERSRTTEMRINMRPTNLKEKKMHL